jgi:hypothetical protein
VKEGEGTGRGEKEGEGGGRRVPSRQSHEIVTAASKPGFTRHKASVINSGKIWSFTADVT